MIHLLVGTAFAISPIPDAPIDLGAGLFFNAGGSFLTDAQDKNVDGRQVLYSGWAGYGNGAGLGIDFRAYGVVGLELDFVYRNDRALSKYTVNNVEYPLETSQMALHIPLLLKVAIPSGPVRPNLFGGREFVLPGEPTITEDYALFDLDAYSENYGAWAFGFGFETVPPNDVIDIRIPLSIRGAYNPGVGDNAGERANYTISDAGVIEQLEYRNVFEWHASITLGVFVYFL